MTKLGDEGRLSKGIDSSRAKDLHAIDKKIERQKTAGGSKQGGKKKV